MKGRANGPAGFPRLKRIAANIVTFPARLEAGPEAPLLINSRGDQFNRSSLTSLVFRLARRAGITRIKVRAHVLRHTYNAIGNAAGVGITERAGLLNHANTHTLQSYDHFFAGQLDAAREKVRAAVAAVTAA